ncbi:DUF3237 domain-containing protein [Novosphingobium sp.]|uniref:DUF3237 domain-containing protein n=1 Tax=Novosphingobium sp. TaxID=1874826 RepID=UPI003BA9EB1F
MITFETALAELGPVRTQPLFVMQVGVERSHALGAPGGADQRVGDMVAGRFAGERLAGAVLPGGSDWQTIRADGTVLLDARVVLRTDDGAAIGMTYEGIRTGPADVLASLARGEPVDPQAYYFRTTARFTTSAAQYDWLNRVIAIGIGYRLPTGPLYSLHEIL